MPHQPQCVRARRSLLGLAIAALSTAATTATAQATLEEVVVTAQKRAQSLQDVPLAVSAIDAQTMRDAGIGDIEDLARQVPTLQIQGNNGPMAVNYRVRRVGNIGNIPTFEPAVGVFQDGAYRNRPIFTAGEMFDVERVEILRGPQSTLYGKNTTAGVVAIYSKAPADGFEGNAQVDAGVVEGEGLAVFLDQERLVVEGIDVADAALHEQEDDAPSLRREVRLERGQGVDGGGAGRVGGEAGQGQVAEAAGGVPEQVTAGEGERHHSLLVPTLCVGTCLPTLCVASVPPRPLGDATQSVGVRSHAERGNEGRLTRGYLIPFFALNSLTYFSGLALNSSRQPEQQT